MPTQTIPHFFCPVCNRKNTWKPALAGKRAKCACGKIIDVPLSAAGMPAAPSPALNDEAEIAPQVTINTSKSVMADIPYRRGLRPEPPPAAPVVPSAATRCRSAHRADRRRRLRRLH